MLIHGSKKSARSRPVSPGKLRQVKNQRSRCPHAHRDTAKRLSESFSKRVEGRGSDQYLLDAVSPRSRSRERAAEAVAGITKRLFEREVIYVKFKGKPLFNGLMSKAQLGRIINIDSQKPFLSVLGHELLHEVAGKPPQNSQDQPRSSRFWTVAPQVALCHKQVALQWHFSGTSVAHWTRKVRSARSR